MLLLKRHLIDLVRAGKKHQTIRLWKTRRLRPGQIAFTPGLGKLKITAIDQLPSLNALTTADARADGFPSKKSLLAEIHAIYGTPLPPNRLVFRIQFQWPLPPTDTAAITARTPAKTTPPKRRPTAKNQLINNPKHENTKIQKPKPPLSRRRPTAAQKKARQSLHHFILSQAPR